MTASLIRRFVFVLLAAVFAVSTAYAADSKGNRAVVGKVWKEPTTGIEFVWIPKGCF